MRPATTRTKRVSLLRLLRAEAAALDNPTRMAERRTIETEADLASLAVALIGDGARLTVAEQGLVRGTVALESSLIDTTIKAIRAGDDPLGTRFCILRSPEHRREQGATYTPPAIVASMIGWAKSQAKVPLRVVDPGSGSGRFLMAAAKAFPEAELVAVELDPLALLLLRANAAVCGFADRLKIEANDFRSLTLPKISGPTLYIGNPPYVRHHDIDEAWKSWFAATAAKFGFRASKLAGLHIHFFLKTRALGQAGDYGAYITAAEWIDVNYGAVLREMLSDGLGGASLHVINPQARPFADALTTGAITCFQIGDRPAHLRINSINSLDQLDDLSQGVDVDWSSLSKGARWSIHVRQSPKPAAGDIELGELFRVHRGQVTGANSVWIAGLLASDLPARFLFPCVTKGRELITAGDVLASTDGLRNVIDLPTDLDDLKMDERRAVDAYLSWAKALGTDKGFIASNRRAWWSVGLREPAPILCTYMARRAPAFVRNLCGARHVNIAHGLYPRQPLSEEAIARILAYLRANVSIDSGRVYAGGLAKFEPGEVQRLSLPTIEKLYEMTI
jgi:hypothetical protein